MFKLLSAVVIVVIIAFFIIGYYFTSTAYKPKYWDYQASLQQEIAHGMIDKAAFDSLPREEFYITASDGVRLNAWYFPSGDAKNTVIIAHGYSYTKYGSVKFMHVFRKLGFNVLLYDQRGHGISTPALCTMGHKEKYDLKKCVDWVVERNGEDIIIGTHGVSMGGATVLLHGAMDDRVDFIVANCPYADVSEQFAHVLKTEQNLPAFPILNAANLVSKLRIGAYFSDIVPQNGLKDITCPVFFIHGTEDDYVPTEHSKRMYAMYKGAKKLYLVEGAKHAYNYFTNPREYEKQLLNFLQEVDILS